MAQVLMADQIQAGMVIVGMAGKIGYEYQNPQPRADGITFEVLSNYPCSVLESDNYGRYWRQGITLVSWRSSTGLEEKTYMDVDDLYLVEVAA